MEIQNQQFILKGDKQVPVTELMYKFDLENFTEEEVTKLKEIAMERFAKDTPAQVEYAVISILREAADKLAVDKLTAKPSKTKKTKGSKNGSKNIDRK